MSDTRDTRPPTAEELLNGANHTWLRSVQTVPDSPEALAAVAQYTTLYAAAGIVAAIDRLAAARCAGCQALLEERDELRRRLRELAV